MARVTRPAVPGGTNESVYEPCRCRDKCGDDGDVDGPGMCKGLPRMPEPPLVEIVLVPRRGAAS